MQCINDLITVREAAKLSGYNPDYISSLIRSGKLRGTKVGKNWMTTADDVRRYARAVQIEAESAKRSLGQKIVARIGAWLERRFGFAFKVGLFIIGISAFLALASYGAYSAVYQNAYQDAQSASTTSAGTQVGSGVGAAAVANSVTSAAVNANASAAAVNAVTATQ